MSYVTVGSCVAFVQLFEWPRCPQVRAGRGLEGLVGVGVRGGRAPVTLALQPRAAAALPLAAPRTEVLWTPGARGPAADPVLGV